MDCITVITVMPDNEIIAHQRMAMLELLCKYIRQRDLTSLQEQLGVLLIENWLTPSQLEALGRRDEAQKIARNMLNAGLSAALVQQLTGLNANDLAAQAE
ncbi:Rpn family recombination-promoting nuclease/putative transposase [Kluyvera sp. 142486]|uniref:Rpn family recombination-promoting nuclease/putative transposase n=1 Tax=Kluyvera sp. 142486 TaxID=3390050 RepID=UPI00397ED14C